MTPWQVDFSDFRISNLRVAPEDLKIRISDLTHILLEDTLDPSLTVSVWDFFSNCGGERGSLGAPSEGTWAKSLREDSLLTSFPAGYV